MKEELMFEGITNIREDIIERSEMYEFPNDVKNAEVRNGVVKKFHKVNPVWVTVAVAAASLLLVFVTPFVYMATRKCGSAAPPGAENVGHVPDAGETLGSSEMPGSNSTGKGNPGDKTSAIAMKDVWIYYVEDGEICREQHYVKVQPADVFEIWKEKNGIGAEVELLDCEIRSNATTEQMGEVVMHKLGDYHSLYLTVSKNLETYYAQSDEQLLLESLEQTMTGYSGMEYQEYHLILE